MVEKIIVGSYTSGIYTANFDPESGTVEPFERVSDINKATYLDVSRAGIVFAAQKDGMHGGVAELELQDNHLGLIDQAVSISPAPVHIRLEVEHQLVFASNYDGGYLQIYHVAEDGRMQLTDTFKNVGRGRLPQQNTAHIHFARLAPDGSLVVLDLGTDQIFVFNFNAETGKIGSLASTFATRPQFGPRHLMFNDAGHAFLLGELASAIAVLKYNPDSQTFTQEQIISTIPDTWNGENGCGGIHLSNDGHFLYASNRGHDSIVVYRIGDDSQLTKVQTISAQGNFPRDFCLSSNGNYLIVGNQKTDNVTVYAVDKSTGTLSVLWDNIPVPEPVCVKML